MTTIRIGAAEDEAVILEIETDDATGNVTGVNFQNSTTQDAGLVITTASRSFMVVLNRGNSNRVRRLLNGQQPNLSSVVRVSMEWPVVSRGG